MYNNYNNDNFNDNPKPLFSNEFPGVGVNNNVVNNINDFVNPAQDIPPVLEPIKNLSDITIVNAPTLDALGPMNIMPESFENKEEIKTDPLDAYDNGINYGNMVNEQVKNDLVNKTSGIEVTQNEINNFELPLVNMPDNYEQSSMNIEITNPEQKADTYILNFDNNIFNPIISETNNLTTVDFKNEENNEFNTNFYSNENSVNNLNIENNADFNNKEEPSSIELENENTSYEIMQDKIEQENSMLSLGIDNAYDDIDMLDIVDVEEEQSEEIKKIENIESSEDNNVQEEKTLIMDHINEIKELINKIKEKDINIELEEFDFEHMYQLIVKIEK